jgi:outer membrane biosynthesis protein TonB
MSFKFSIFNIAVLTIVLGSAADAQSTDPNFPTNVTTNEIDGTVRARDIGDSRLTSHYYTFDGGQGDMFINVVTRNFTGDIDVFAAEGLRPLSKMVILADGNPNETGRVVYMRRPERIILRVQGRTPNDDAATYRIKFAGSFIALAGKSDDTAPKLTQPEEVSDAGIRVNSVGTIVEVIPKAEPPKKAGETVTTAQQPPQTVAKAKTEQAPTETKPKEPPTVVVTENIPAARPVEKPKTTAQPARKSVEGPATVFHRKPKPKTTGVAVKPAPKPPPPPAEKAPDPLANIHLVVLLKDGNKVERRMSEVQKFSVDGGVLTVIGKDGTVVHYPILDVAKVTIE